MNENNVKCGFCISSDIVIAIQTLDFAGTVSHKKTVTVFVLFAIVATIYNTITPKFCYMSCTHIRYCYTSISLMYKSSVTMRESL